MKMRRLVLASLLSFTVCVLFSGSRSLGAPQAASSHPHGLADILGYISNGWNVLTRSMTDCHSVSDTKGSGKSVLYFPADMPIPDAEQALEKNCAVRVEHLPSVIHRLGEIDVNKIQPQGLLYLEHPYVVPGGMFNEMYGWDSYFIIRGLLRADKAELARGMVDNFFFEIDHYGGILNANRTYHLTRSQPPFLTSMIMAVYEAEKGKGRADVAWLEKGYRYAARDYLLWTHEPHLAGPTGLSRYYDFGDGPVPELGPTGPSYYRAVVRYFLLHPQWGQSYLGRDGGMASGADLTGPRFSLVLCSDEKSAPSRETCEDVEPVGLSSDYYKGDRAVRESGFDITFCFDPYGAGTHHFAAVGLNSLLYKVEKDMEQMATLLGHTKNAQDWSERAAQRRAAINTYLWNQDRGLYFDYDFMKQKQSSYNYAATFYPLWVGLASSEQARAVDRNLQLLEQPGGLAMSQNETGAQWDYPYGWAPVHLIALEGLRRYGYDEDADRLSFKFLSTVLENFRRDGTIREKYNVVTRSSETKVVVGYMENVVGFGWTNGVFLELLHALSKDRVARLIAQ